MCLLMGDTKNHKALKEETVIGRGVCVWLESLLKRGSGKVTLTRKGICQEGYLEEMICNKVKKEPSPGKGEQVPGFILLASE